MTPTLDEGDGRHDRRQQRKARWAVAAGLLGSAGFTVAMVATAAGPPDTTPVVAVHSPAAPVGVSPAGLNPSAEPPAAP